MWRNWQTRTAQDRMGAIPWRFKSSHPHQAYSRIFNEASVSPTSEGHRRHTPKQSANPRELHESGFATIRAHLRILKERPTTAMAGGTVHSVVALEVAGPRIFAPADRSSERVDDVNERRRMSGVRDSRAASRFGHAVRAKLIPRIPASPSRTKPRGLIAELDVHNF